MCTPEIQNIYYMLLAYWPTLICTRVEVKFTSAVGPRSKLEGADLGVHGKIENINETHTL